MPADSRHSSAASLKFRAVLETKIKSFSWRSSAWKNAAASRPQTHSHRIGHLTTSSVLTGQFRQHSATSAKFIGSYVD